MVYDTEERRGRIFNISWDKHYSEREESKYSRRYPGIWGWGQLVIP